MGGSAVDVASGRERAAGDCCVDGERIRLIGVVPRSDGEGEFGEGRREPLLWVEFHAEFVVAAADVWTNACPALITRAERSRLRPRMGLSRDLSRP